MTVFCLPSACPLGSSTYSDLKTSRGTVSSSSASTMPTSSFSIISTSTFSNQNRSGNAILLPRQPSQGGWNEPEPGTPSGLKFAGEPALESFSTEEKVWENPAQPWMRQTLGAFLSMGQFYTFFLLRCENPSNGRELERPCKDLLWSTLWIICLPWFLITTVTRLYPGVTFTLAIWTGGEKKK